MSFPHPFNSGLKEAGTKKTGLKGLRQTHNTHLCAREAKTHVKQWVCSMGSNMGTSCNIKGLNFCNLVEKNKTNFTFDSASKISFLGVF